MKIKKLLALLMSLSLAFYFAGCGNSSEEAPQEESTQESTQSEASPSEPSSSGDKTVITFWHAMGGSMGPALDELVAKYNASQDEVEVVAQYQGSYDDTLTKLRSSAAGSEVEADLVQVFEVGTQFMIDSGLTVPVQDFIDKDNFDTSVLEENLLAYYTLGDKLYSMPFNSSTPLCTTIRQLLMMQASQKSQLIWMKLQP